MEFNSVYDALRSTSLPSNSIGRPSGGWIRIPAVWRSRSIEGDVAVNVESGVAFDHAMNESFSFKTLMERLNVYDASLPLTAKRLATKARTDHELYKLKIANSVWESGRSLADESWKPSQVARQYFENRKIPVGIVNSIASVVRASKMQHNKKGVMLLLPIRSPTTESITGIQRIFLNDDGTKRTQGLDEHGVEVPMESKMMLGHHFEGNYAGGILLQGTDGGLNRTVVVCEGFETGLAIMAGTGLSVYIAYNTNGMERICLNYLMKSGFTNIIIAADNDDMNKYGIRPGIKAATVLAGKIYDEVSRQFNIALAPRINSDKKCDWLDVWETNAAKFKHLFKTSQIEYDPATDKYRNKASELPPIRTKRI